MTIAAYIGKCIKNLRLKLGKNTDERLQATQETLTAIKIIKMYTWERVFIGRVEEKRKYNYQNTVNHTLNHIVTKFQTRNANSTQIRLFRLTDFLAGCFHFKNWTVLADDDLHCLY